MTSSKAQDDWIERVLGFRAGGPGSASSGQARDGDIALFRELEAEAAALAERDPTLPTTVGALLERAATFAADGDDFAALKVLSEATELLADVGAATVTSGGAAPMPREAPLIAALARAQTYWDGVRRSAQDEASGVQDQLSAVSIAHAEALTAVIESYWQDLAASFPEGRTLRSEQEAEAARGRVMASIQALRAEITGDTMLAAVVAAGGAVREIFLSAFDEVERLVPPSARASAEGPAR